MPHMAVEKNVAPLVAVLRQKRSCVTLALLCRGVGGVCPQGRAHLTLLRQKNKFIKN